MMRFILRRSFIALTTMLALSSTIIAIAQPHGWKHDYGFRDGNMWVYKVIGPKAYAYYDEGISEHIDSTGKYWLLVSPFEGRRYRWLRIDSAGTIDRFRYPEDTFFERWFIEGARKGDVWAIDSTITSEPGRAIVDSTYVGELFGLRTSSKIIIYESDQGLLEGKYTALEFTPRFGITRKWSYPDGYEELMGAIIDGVVYGQLLGDGVADDRVESAARVTAHPLPASSYALLNIIAHGEHRAVLEIHDMLGRLVLRRQLDDLHDGLNTIPLDVAMLPSSSYMIAVDIGGSRLTTPLVLAR